MVKYNLIPKPNPERAYFLITMKGDVNDADYIIETTKVYADNEVEVTQLFEALDIFDKIKFPREARTGKIRLAEGLKDLDEEVYDFITEIINFPRDIDWGNIAHTLEDFFFEYYGTDGKVYYVTDFEIEKDED